MPDTKYSKRKLRSGLSLLILLAIPLFTFSQESTVSQINLSYSDYMKMVINGNIEYIVQKYNVNIADAKIEASKVFQDPSVSIDRVKTYEDNSSDSYSYSTEISKTFNLRQKRKARINLAKSESILTSALVSDHLRNLMADATIDYLTALKENYLYNVMHNSWLMMKELSEADSIRLSLGSIKSIDAIQSKIEAGILFNDLLQIEADRKNAFINLSSRTSIYHTDTIFYPVGKFDNAERSIVLDELLTIALNNRADLLAAESTMAHNRNYLALTRSERGADIDIRLGATNSFLNNKIASPVTNEIYAGVSVPLKFSNFNKGELKIAQIQIEQGELIYEQIEIKIKNEVVQAYNQYRSLCRQVDNYSHGLLEQSEIVLNGKVYSYSRGETSLLEVLNAQRTFNDLQTSYYGTLYNCYAALVELERAIGTCNIEL